MQIISYNQTFGEVEVVFDKKAYTYYNVNPYNYKKLQFYLRKRRHSLFVKYLKNFRRDI